MGSSLMIRLMGLMNMASRQQLLLDLLPELLYWMARCLLVILFWQDLCSMQDIHTSQRQEQQLHPVHLAEVVGAGLLRGLHPAQILAPRRHLVNLHVPVRDPEGIFKSIILQQISIGRFGHLGLYLCSRDLA
jgi:hypothetical protein